MIVEDIAAVPLFNGLRLEHLEKLVMISTDQEVSRGQTIFSEGDDGNGLYIVQSGKIKIFKLSLEGKEQILHVLGAGEPFGEVALFTGQSFPAYAMALEKSRIFYFPRETFFDLIQSEPAVSMNMLAVLSMRLKKFANMIESLSLKEVPGRLATHLLLLSDQQEGTAELTLTITKAQLASLLGTIPETLSRILAKMNKEGYITLDGSNIRLEDRDGLEDLAAGAVRI